jgi:hypothetical protein
MCAHTHTNSSTMTLDLAWDGFVGNPTPTTAAIYLEQLLQYEADDMIGDDTFLNGLHEICDFLRERKFPGVKR